MRVAVLSIGHRPVRAGGRDWASGPAVHVTELAAALAHLGHDVRVYTRRSSPSQPEQSRDPAGVTTVSVPVGPPRATPPDEEADQVTAFGQWLDRSWRQGWAPDVVHAHGWPSALSALVAKSLASRPTVVTSPPIGAGLGHRDVIEQATRGADALVALSRGDAHILRRLGVPAAKVSVIPSGVDTEQFAPDGRAWARRRTHRVLAVGQLVPENGFAAPVTALPDLPDTELVIVGRPPPPSHGLGPHAAALRALAVNNAVHDRLRLTGGAPYRDMPAWYRSADLLVCAPSYPSFGRAAVEAMACGVPVVASAVGGLPETVTDGVCGVLVPPDSPGLLAKAVRTLLADPALRRGYGTAAAELARRQHTWHRAAQSIMDLYHHARTHHTLTAPDRRPASVLAA
jgi:D-inositol-3-phosphate glycosyltransferase